MDPADLEDKHARACFWGELPALTRRHSMVVAHIPHRMGADAGAGARVGSAAGSDLAVGDAVRGRAVVETGNPVITLEGIVALAPPTDDDEHDGV